MKENKTKSMIILLINILFVTFFSISSSKCFSNNSNIADTYNHFFTWICILAMIEIISFKMKKISIYDFILWFIAISYFFMFGFIFQGFFNLKTTLLWNPLKYYSYNEIFKAYSFAILSLSSFSTGYLIFYFAEKSINKYGLKELKKQSYNKKMFIIGVTVLTIGTIAKLINDIGLITKVRVANSYTAFSTATSTGLFDDLAFLCLPGLFCIFYSGCATEKSKKNLFYFFLIYYIVMMLLTGSRKIQVFSILSLTLGYNFSIERRKEKVPIWKIIVYLVLSLITVNILIIIRKNRFDLSTIIPTFVDNLLSLNLFENIFGEVFSETGITILSVASIIKSVPAIFPFEYGKTFLRTIPSIFPIGWLSGDFFSKASSTNVINAYTKIPVGSSFIGDLYWNWGYCGGILMAFVSGIIVQKIISINNKQSRIGYAIYFSVFSQLIVLVRAELFDIFRPLFMIFIIKLIIEKVKIPIKEE